MSLEPIILTKYEFVLEKFIVARKSVDKKLVSPALRLLKKPRKNTAPESQQTWVEPSFHRDRIGPGVHHRHVAEVLFGNGPRGGGPFQSRMQKN
jgi:hypothetical protein